MIKEKWLWAYLVMMWLMVVFANFIDNTHLLLMLTLSLFACSFSYGILAFNRYKINQKKDQEIMDLLEVHKEMALDCIKVSKAYRELREATKWQNLN